MNCVFQLNSYRIQSVAVACNDNYDRNLNSHTGDIAASINIEPHVKDKAKYRLGLEIRITPTAKKEKEFFPYSVAIKGRANFTFKDPCPAKEANHTLRLNGASILYGLLRAQVAQITAQSVHGQFLLPTLNFLEMANRQDPESSAAPAKVSEKTATYPKSSKATTQPAKRKRREPGKEKG